MTHELGSLRSTPPRTARLVAAACVLLAASAPAALQVGCGGSTANVGEAGADGSPEAGRDATHDAPSDARHDRTNHPPPDSSDSPSADSSDAQADVATDTGTDSGGDASADAAPDATADAATEAALDAGTDGGDAGADASDAASPPDANLPLPDAGCVQYSDSGTCTSTGCTCGSTNTCAFA